MLVAPEHLPPWLHIAIRELGVAEWKAPGKHNPRILEYGTCTRAGTDTDEVPWCACFVCWCLEQAGIAHTRSRAAVSYRDYGVPCGFLPGAIVYFPPDDPAAGSTGHVAFLWSTWPTRIRVIGGNQQNRVSLAYRPRRPGVQLRWPPGYPLPSLAA